MWSTKLTARPPPWWRLSKPKSTSAQTQTFFVVVVPGIFPNFLFHTSYWGIIRLFSRVSGTPNGSSGLFALEPSLVQQRARIWCSRLHRETRTVYMFTLLIYGVCRVCMLSFLSPYWRGEPCRKTNWRHSCKHFSGPGTNFWGLLEEQISPTGWCRLAYRAQPNQRRTSAIAGPTGIWRLMLISSLSGRNTSSFSSVSGDMLVCPLKLKQRGKSRRTRSGPAGVWRTSVYFQ